MQKVCKSSTSEKSDIDIKLACKRLDLDVVMRKAKLIQDDIDKLSEALARSLQQRE